MPLAWLDTFRPFTLQHAVCGGACLAIMFGVSYLGLSLKRKSGADSVASDCMRLAIGWLGIAYWIGSNIWWNWPGNYDLQRSLPIQVCDLAGLIGPLALLIRARALRAITYFWGIALSTQGFIQPVLTKGAAYTEFWLFWANHTIVVGTAVYDVIARGFRPAWRDYFLAAAAILAYLVIILPIDIVWHLNYGYVGNTTPENRTIIDDLGPWPLRILPLSVIALGVMAAIQVPWVVAARRSRVAPNA
ncbi:MAG: TIGR02206 family membrane protein [Phycisphaerales bacterium]